MKILVAMDSFKGSLSSLEAGQAAKRGIARVLPRADVSILPLADGGEGTAETLAYALNGQYHYEEVLDPLGRKTEGYFVLLPDNTAVVELAVASGLTLLQENERNPFLTSTYGTGQLIRAALARGAKKIIVGLGGSATNDGGAGLLQALGVELLDKNRNSLPLGGIHLKDLAYINAENITSEFKSAQILIASDVNNPLLGESGASAIFGPQKGATPSQVEALDAALSNYNQVLFKTLGKNFKDIKGAGAAGGTTVALLAFSQAQIEPGIDLVLDTLNFEEKLKKADLLIGGEGKIDKQTLLGKGLMGLAQRARKYNVPFLALAGSIEEGAEGLYQHGLRAMLPIAPGPITLESSLTQAAQLIETTSERALRLITLL